MNSVNIAIFASGSGSTAEAFIRDVAKNQYPLQVKLVICNNPQAFILERIQSLNDELGLAVVTAVLNSHTQPSALPVVHGQQTAEEQARILTLLNEHNIDLVLLLGYMKQVGAELVASYGWLPDYPSVYECRMLNTHPGLLPATIGTHGLGTQEFTLNQHMEEGGQTLHAVSSEYDTGPTVSEHRVAVLPDDTAESLFARVQSTEKAHIAADVVAFLEAQQMYRKERV